MAKKTAAKKKPVVKKTTKAALDNARELLKSGK